MKIRLTEVQAKNIAEVLVVRNLSLAATLRYAGITQPIDDTSEQLLETLVFNCVACDTWRGIEELSEDNVCAACFVHDPDRYEEPVY